MTQLHNTNDHNDDNDNDDNNNDDNDDNNNDNNNDDNNDNVNDNDNSNDNSSSSSSSSSSNNTIIIIIIIIIIITNFAQTAVRRGLEQEAALEEEIYQLYYFVIGLPIDHMLCNMNISERRAVAGSTGQLLVYPRPGRWGPGHSHGFVKSKC